jgi:hypothetical protein
MSAEPQGPSGTRVTTVAVVGVVVGVASAALWLAITRTGRLVPAPPWLAALALVALAVLVLWFAWPVRRYLRSGGSRSIDPIRAARAVVLAQAGALTGGAAAGWYAGQVVAIATDLSLMVNQGRLWRVLLMVALAVALAVAGFVAQRWCRVDPPSQD